MKNLCFFYIPKSIPSVCNTIFKRIAGLCFHPKSLMLYILDSFTFCGNGKLNVPPPALLTCSLRLDVSRGAPVNVCRVRFCIVVSVDSVGELLGVGQGRHYINIQTVHQTNTNIRTHSVATWHCKNTHKQTTDHTKYCSPNQYRLHKIHPRPSRGSPSPSSHLPYGHERHTHLHIHGS